jgi:hypothetical protein
MTQHQGLGSQSAHLYVQRYTHKYHATGETFGMGSISGYEGNQIRTPKDARTVENHG